MITLTITKNQMVADINGDLCGRLEAMTCSLEYDFDSKKNYAFFRDWPHQGVGDLTKVNDKGESLLGFPGTMYNHGWHFNDRPVCHPWLQEQEDKYPGFIAKVWKHMKGF